MVGPLQTNVGFSTEYWMRLAVIAMFGWTTTVEPLLAQTPPASDAAQQAPGATGTPLRRQRQPIKPPTSIQCRISSISWDRSRSIRIRFWR